MFKHLCPKCGKYSYSSAEENFLPCPYCAFRFCSNYGADRRSEARIASEEALVLTLQGQRLEAKAIDFSKGGMGIEILGRFQLKVGDTVDVSRGDFGMQKTKVIWTKQMSDKCFVGLKGLN
jgi:PilZ domain